MPRLAGAMLAVLALGASACGGTSGAEDSLTSQLEAVDAAAVAADDARLESAVGRLLAAVEDSEAAGDVTPSHAERIRRAAESLLEASAPAGRRDRSEPAEPPEPATSTSSPPVGDDDGDDDGEGEEADEDDEHSPPAPGGPHGPGKAKGHEKHD